MTPCSAVTPAGEALRLGWLRAVLQRVHKSQQACANVGECSSGAPWLAGAASARPAGRPAHPTPVHTSLPPCRSGTCGSCRSTLASKKCSLPQRRRMTTRRRRSLGSAGASAPAATERVRSAAQCDSLAPRRATEHSSRPHSGSRSREHSARPAGERPGPEQPSTPHRQPAGS